MMGEVERAAEVLVQHQRIPTYDARDSYRCSGCDSLKGESDGPNSPRHAIHVAEALAAANLLAESTAEPAAEVGLRAAIEAKLRSWDGVAAGDSPCDAVVSAVLADLRAALADHAPQAGEVRGGRGEGA